MNYERKQKLILESAKKVERWVEAHEYKGYEPFDGLSSYLRPLTFGNLFLDRVLMQLVRRSPINLRPFLGIKPLESTIGRGYMAWGYLTMLKATGAREYEQKARQCLDWLIENKSPGYDEYCWGKHFDFASRGGRYPKLEPLTVWTSLIGMAFVEGYEVLGETRYISVAQSICRWIMGLSRKETDTGTYLSYTASGQPVSIHNHNMLAAAIISRTAKHTPKNIDLSLARSVMRYCCARQLKNGAWYYGEEPMYHWIDNFHTGYNLDALKCYIDSTGDPGLIKNLNQGLDFYIGNLILNESIPKYYHSRTYPVDSQCISQSIDTLANFNDYNNSAVTLAIKIANWAIENMQDKTGFFYYRQYPLFKAKIPMLHWAQATMYKALVFLSVKLHSVTT